MSNHQNELESLKKQAKELGISFGNNISINTLKTKIEEKLQEDAIPANLNESEISERAKKLKEATKLIRVIVVPTNPSKKELEGEIFSVSNNICSLKKYVPYNNEQGYHIPNILYQTLKEKKTQIFVNKTLKNGTTVREGKQIPAYNIVVLDSLTEEELKELASAQKARQSIEE